jgi:hypothetical protein
LAQLLGGGAIETFCPKCGFAYRQTTARPIPRQEHFWFRIARSLPNPAQDWSQRPGFQPTPGKVVALVMVAFFFVALRALFVGYPSYEPVLFAQLYVFLVSAVVLGVPSFVYSARRIKAWQVAALWFLGIIGMAWLSGFAPVIGEPNYCNSWDIDWRSAFSHKRPTLPPKIFRCTEIPFDIAGFFAAWWIGTWLFNWWNSRGADDGADHGPHDRTQVGPRLRP